MGRVQKGEDLKAKTRRVSYGERLLGFKVRPVQRDGSCNGSPKEVEGAVLKEDTTLDVFLPLSSDCLLSYLSNTAVLDLVGVYIRQPQAFQLRRIQFWGGHPPEKKGAGSTTHGASHNCPLSRNL